MEERTRGPRRDTRTRKPMTPQERRNLLYKRWRKAEQQKVDAKELRDPTTCDMVVFDLELAGYAEDDIIEIAAIKVDFLGRQTAVFRELIRPRTKISKRVTEMTGITRDMVKDKPQLPEVLKRFFAFVEGSIVMGHDIGYNDIMAINLACRRYGMKAFRPPFLDTSRLILRHLSREAVGGKTGLAALLAHFNIPIHRHHEALADCAATLLLYEAVAKEIRKQKSHP